MFWEGFEKRSYKWKTQMIGSAAAPVVGAGLGVHTHEQTPYRGAIMGASTGAGAAAGSAAGKLIGDVLKGVAEGNPEKLRNLKAVGSSLPLILGLVGASMGGYEAMKWMAGLREAPESTQRPPQEQS